MADERRRPTFAEEKMSAPTERRGKYFLEIGRLAVFLIAIVTAGCASNDTSPSPPTSTDNDASTTRGAPCGASCETDDDCKGEARCLPAASGGLVCKPPSCPECPSGKFCVYDKETCTASGSCTSFSCGFTFVDNCDECVTAECCAEWRLCATDDGCANVATCISGCADAACVAKCWKNISGRLGFETSRTFYQRAANCALAKCSNSACPLGPAAAPGVCRAAGVGCAADKDCCGDARCMGADINARDTKLCCRGSAAPCKDDDECCFGECGPNGRCASAVCKGCDRFDECSPFGECCKPDVQCGLDQCGVQRFCPANQHCVDGQCAAGCTANDCEAGATCVNGYCTRCSDSCNGQTCGTTCSGASCGECSGDRECLALNGGYYCGYAPCTPQCAGKECGDNGCHSSCGQCATGKTCSPTGQCVTRSGGGTGGTGGGTDPGPGGSCVNQSGCISYYAAPEVCAGSIGLRSKCTEQVSCHFVLSDGTEGCTLPTPGSNDCAISASGAKVKSLTCVSGDVDCVNSIGCDL